MREEKGTIGNGRVLADAAVVPAAADEADGRQQRQASSTADGGTKPGRSRLGDGSAAGQAWVAP